MILDNYIHCISELFESILIVYNFVIILSVTFIFFISRCLWRTEFNAPVILSIMICHVEFKANVNKYSENTFLNEYYVFVYIYIEDILGLITLIKKIIL